MIKVIRKFVLILAIMALCVLSACENGSAANTTSQASEISRSESTSSERSHSSEKTQESTASKDGDSAASKAESSDTMSKDENIAESSRETYTIPETDITFDNSYAFLGNSIIGDLEAYELTDDADVYSNIGLNVSSVFDQKKDGHKQAILDELLSKDYKTIFIMFGMNELGWSYPEIFIDNYSELIDTIREALPDADISLISITPITKSQEKLKEGELNIKRINDYNKKINELANTKNVKYLDVYKYLADEGGYLPENDSPDGFHLTPGCSLKFVKTIKFLSTK